jgi:hypothetical protein
VRCHRCWTEARRERIGVREVCLHCAAYLHCCRNCDFFAPGAANDCHEPNAERVADKVQGNFCDYFRPTASGTAPTGEPTTKARDALNALFTRGKR